MTRCVGRAGLRPGARGLTPPGARSGVRRTTAGGMERLAGAAPVARRIRRPCSEPGSGARVRPVIDFRRSQGSVSRQRWPWPGEPDRSEDPETSMVPPPRATRSTTGSVLTTAQSGCTSALRNRRVSSFKGCGMQSFCAAREIDRNDVVDRPSGAETGEEQVLLVDDVAGIGRSDRGRDHHLRGLREPGLEAGADPLQVGRGAMDLGAHGVPGRPRRA